MDQPKTSRPFEQRFLDGYGRSDLRQEVLKVKPSRFCGLRKKYATWALGASLAFGGLGVPMKLIHNAESARNASAAARVAPAPEPGQSPGIESDLQQAQSIAQKVAGGVTTGMQMVTTGVQQAASAPVQAIELAPEKMAVISDAIRQQFFAREVPFG
ncbi:MAG TPA: hypothetical protein VF381_12970 [Thermoanaerobaculia bacterium]